ncbi:MAG: hypothetical protein OEM97_08270, partial [Acidimicrobiia bacterium]|nr:hypothetical protein [Acidimicrobiia bacterium]
MVADAIDATKGVVITASYETNPKDADPADPANIRSSCTTPTDFEISANTQLVVTCGSVTVDVIRGTVETTFTASDGTLASTSLGGGNSVTFEPETATFTAPPTNPDPVVVTVGGQEISVSPGVTLNVPPVVTSVTGPLEPFRTGTEVERRPCSPTPAPT